jgi:hypothetical protein
VPRRAARQATWWRDYVWLALGLGALLLLTSLPYIYGRLSAPPGRQFMGIVSDVPDTAQYFSWLRAHQRALIVSNWMTPEPNAPAFFNLLWLALGRLSLWTGLSFAACLQLLRVIAGAGFAGALFWLYGLLAESQRERWLATALVLVGGGVGWVWAIEKYAAGRTDLLFPLDVQVAEPNAFLSLLGYPHFLLAAAFVLAIFGLFIAGARSGRVAPHICAALLALLLGLQHAYDLITIYCALGAFVLLRWWSAGRFPAREIAGLAVIGLVSSPPAAYFAYLTSQNPIWRQVLAQFDNAGVFTPNPLHLLIVFGPQLPLAVAMLPALARRRSEADLLLLAWVIVGFGLLYIPTDFQIHMLNPYQVPLALLAARAALRYAARPGAGAALRRFAPAALVLVASLVNVYLLGWRFVDLARHQAPYYLHNDEVAALAWLDRQAGDSVTLSSETLGQYVPALAGKRAVLAHWAQTVDYYGKRDEVTRFFDSATSEADRAAIVRRYGVTYVLAGEREILVSGRLDSPLLEPVFTASNAIVYRVR